MIHRAADGWVTFALKGEAMPDGSRRWIEVGGIRASELENLFPEVITSLTKDSFFSINSMWYDGRRSYETLSDGRRVPYTHPLTGLTPVRRSQDRLRFLNAISVSTL